jgi:hypothetical protein
VEIIIDENNMKIKDCDDNRTKEWSNNEWIK